MAECKWCGRKGIFLSVSGYGLCATCEPAILMDFQQRYRIMQDCRRIISESKNLDTLISRCDLLIRHAEALTEYERKGIPTTNPPASEVARQVREQRDSIIYEGAAAAFEKAIKKADSAATPRGSISAANAALRTIQKGRREMERPERLDELESRIETYIHNRQADLPKSRRGEKEASVAESAVPPRLTGPLLAELDLPEVVVPAETFWADHIKILKEQPLARLALGLQNLPLPAAFRESAIALRGLIRETRSAGDSHHYLLQELHRLSSINEFLFATPHFDDIGPAYNVAESIGREVWESLAMPYEEIGYQELTLLTKTDVGWLTESWGEPKRHRNPQEFHARAWRRAVDEYRAQERERERDFDRYMKDLLNN